VDIQQQFGSDVKIIGVPGSDDLGSLRSFVDDTGTGAVTHITDNDEIWRAFEVRRRQTYVFVTADGSQQTIEFNNLESALSELTAR
jgi:hypothetical protein